MYILIAILAFGVIVFVHELGHFLAAKACGVKVLEFAVGMGPRLLHVRKGETEYSLRALPMGGFCAMEGEEESSNDPRAFNNQSVLRRLIILAAGSFMNFFLGFLLLMILYAPAGGFTSTVIEEFFPGCPYAGDLTEGDQIYRINGKRVYFTSNVSEFADQDPDGIMDIELIRDGKHIKLKDYHFVRVPYETEDGGQEMKFGIYFRIEEASLLTNAKYSLYNCFDFVRMVRQGLVMLFRGEAGMNDMTGVVGIVDIINETGQSAPTVSEGVDNILFIVAFIAVNLSVMNMLPIPALDGGHILTLLISSAYEKISGKKPDPRIERYIHSIGLILLLLLMGVVFFNDIVRIIRR